MLFLFNAHVIDIGDAVKRLSSQDFPLSLPAAGRLSQDHIEGLFREAAFKFDDLVDISPGKAAALAALAAWRVGANAALAVRPDGARSADDCIAKFADVSIQTIAWLGQQATSGSLTRDMIDSEVWSRAA